MRNMKPDEYGRVPAHDSIESELLCKIPDTCPFNHPKEQREIRITGSNENINLWLIAFMRTRDFAEAVKESGVRVIIDGGPRESTGVNK